MKVHKKIKIGILDFSTANFKAPKFSTEGSRVVKSLIREIKDQGHIPILYKVENCQMYFHGRKAEILYKNKEIKKCDVLVVKFLVTNGVDLAVSIIKQFQLMGIPIINKYLPTIRAKNKLRTLQILCQHNIAVPKTVVVRKIELMDESIKAIGGYPVVVKIPFGSGGAGVFLLESRRSLLSVLDAIGIQRESNLLLLQEYIEESKGSDFRAFVLGDRVIAAMQRSAKEGDFRSNLHQGGGGQKVILTPEEEKIAVKASKALGLKMAGVDILRSKRGPLIIEVNANPGFAGITRVTGINVAGEIIKYAASMVSRPSDV